MFNRWQWLVGWFAEGICCRGCCQGLSLWLCIFDVGVLNLGHSCCQASSGKTRDRGSDSYLFECPLSCLHSSKIQIFCFIKWKSASFDEKNLCFSELLAGFWRKKNLLKWIETWTWDMDMRHETWTWDMDMRHETWTWDMDTKLKVQATFLTCTSFSHLHYMHQF